MQVSEKEVRAAMPDKVYPRWVAGSYICIAVFGGVLATALLWGNPTSRSITAWSFACGGVWLLLSIILVRGGNKTIGDFHRVWLINNRIGFQRIWMLGPDDTVDTRLERRDHQNAQHNTSKYSVYEQLGGPDARTFIGRKVDGSEFISEVEWVTLESYGGGWRVRGKSVKYDDVTTIQALLRVLNATDGQLGFNACMTLASTTTLLKHALSQAERAKNAARKKSGA